MQAFSYEMALWIVANIPSFSITQNILGIWIICKLWKGKKIMTNSNNEIKFGYL